MQCCRAKCHISAVVATTVRSGLRGLAGPSRLPPHTIKALKTRRFQGLLQDFVFFPKTDALSIELRVRVAPGRRIEFSPIAVALQ
jgi:hypothetical protein